MSSAEVNPIYSPFFGVMGAASAIIFSGKHRHHERRVVPSVVRFVRGARPRDGGRRAAAQRIAQARRLGLACARFDGGRELTAVHLSIRVSRAPGMVCSKIARRTRSRKPKNQITATPIS